MGLYEQPKWLYHATFESLYEDIASDGLCRYRCSPYPEHERSEDHDRYCQFVYLADTESDAISFFELAQSLTEDDALAQDDCVVFAVKTDDLARDLIDLDENNIYNFDPEYENAESGFTYQYSGDIPPDVLYCVEYGKYRPVVS